MLYMAIRSKFLVCWIKVTSCYQKYPNKKQAILWFLTLDTCWKKSLNNHQLIKRWSPWKKESQWTTVFTKRTQHWMSCLSTVKHKLRGNQQTFFYHKQTCIVWLYETFLKNIWKWTNACPVQRAPALCGVWGRVLVASLTLACAMRGDRDSNPGPSGHRR